MPITKGLIKFATCSARRAFLSRALACPRLTGKGVCQPKEAAARGLSVKFPAAPAPRSAGAKRRCHRQAALAHAPAPVPPADAGPLFF